MNDLELSIMSCLVLKPKLIEEIIVEDKHFVKHQRLWQFMKSFYKKFKTFDAQLMYAVCKDKWQIASYIIQLAEIEVTTINFKKYQELLIEDFEKSKKEKWLKDRIYEIANDFYVGNINSKEFKTKCDEFYNISKEVFQNE